MYVFHLGSNSESPWKADGSWEVETYSFDYPNEEYIARSLERPCIHFCQVSVLGAQSPLYVDPRRAGASLVRNADRSGFLRGCKHHHQRSGLQNWPKSDVGSMIISQLSQLAVDSVLPQAQHVLNTSSLENCSGQVMREP